MTAEQAKELLVGEWKRNEITLRFTGEILTATHPNAVFHFLWEVYGRKRGATVTTHGITGRSHSFPFSIDINGDHLNWGGTVYKRVNPCTGS